MSVERCNIKIPRFDILNKRLFIQKKNRLDQKKLERPQCVHLLSIICGIINRGINRYIFTEKLIIKYTQNEIQYDHKNFNKKGNLLKKLPNFLDEIKSQQVNGSIVTLTLKSDNTPTKRFDKLSQWTYILNVNRIFTTSIAERDEIPPNPPNTIVRDQKQEDGFATSTINKQQTVHEFTYTR